MKRISLKILGLSVVGMLASCGPDAEPSADVAASRSTLGAVPAAATHPLPPITLFERWDGKTPFYPADTKRTNTILTVSPDTNKRFRAYGIDTLKGAIVFQVDGPKAAYTRFTTELNRENLVLAQQSKPGDEKVEIISGNGGMPSPRPGPHEPDPELLFKTALNLEGAYAGLYAP